MYNLSQILSRSLKIRKGPEVKDPAHDESPIGVSKENSLITVLQLQYFCYNAKSTQHHSQKFRECTRLVMSMRF